MKIEKRQVVAFIAIAIIVYISLVFAFSYGRVYQLEAMTAPRETDNIIDGTCREILFKSEREGDAINP